QQVLHHARPRLVLGRLPPDVRQVLGVDPAAYVSSPTFTIMHRYLGRLPLYHIDLYL
ncbi:MAG: tRNA (adenosine(37)-N6)-threonylcarbamoyltransferase complex ATPase subunit type 1 TsaE, partial [Erysipelotrichaceae bacterium]|nr:tRNA (adenosine(37)-N6)-threonylcarbamoyltransferase complex ATPase subunit type 1 TsaE [Erysipelotrichaceae bacterium]